MTDLEQALAEAMKKANRLAFAELRMDNGDRMVPANIDHYVKTYLLATPVGKAIARQAAIGAAVERLPKGATLNCDLADGWWQVITFPPNGRAKWCPSIPEAIAAALEDAT